MINLAHINAQKRTSLFIMTRQSNYKVTSSIKDERECVFMRVVNVNRLDLHIHKRSGRLCKIKQDLVIKRRVCFLITIRILIILEIKRYTANSLFSPLLSRSFEDVKDEDKDLKHNKQNI